MTMIISTALFAIFFLNVFLGASGAGRFLTDVQELLILITSVLFFVAAILKRETAAKQRNPCANPEATGRQHRHA